MLLDDYGSNGITAHLFKVKPGMVYVDLKRNGSTRELYSAFHRGASVIFTSKNIMNPDLPVIKEHQIENKYLMLLDEYFGHPLEKIRLITISGGGNNYKLLKILENMWNRQLTIHPVSFYSEEGFNEPGNYSILEDFYADILKKSSAGNLPVLFCMRNGSNSGIASRFKPDCCIITDIDETPLDEQVSIIKGLGDGKPLIINADGAKYNNLCKLFERKMVIDYGLKKNAMVTASSVVYDETSSFNYCLQKSMVTRSGKMVEPFEIPVRMKLPGSESIYNALAAITCGLFYDLDMPSIQAALLDYGGQEGMRFIYNGTYKILECICRSAKDLLSVFENVQSLNYRKLYLVISLSTEMKRDGWKGMVECLAEWGVLLNSSVIFLSLDSALKPASIRTIKYLRKTINQYNLSQRFEASLDRTLANARKMAEKGDLIVVIKGPGEW